MPSTDGRALGASERETLLRIAHATIREGTGGAWPSVPLDELPPALRVPRATFVTITIDQVLRGCIGALEPYRPLAVDVAENAHAAAFSDPRFPPVGVEEAERLHVHISLLDPPEPLACMDEDDLIRQLRPGVDGLILCERGRRATFLPSVWQSLPEPRDFLRHLKRKAGLPADGWSSGIRVERYTVSSIF